MYIVFFYLNTSKVMIPALSESENSSALTFTDCWIKLPSYCLGRIPIGLSVDKDIHENIS